MELKMEKMDSFTEERPWGSFEQFILNKKCSVKIMRIKNGEAISFQYHQKRAQFYYILDDGFIIWVGDKKDKAKYEIVTPKPGDRFFFEQDQSHRAFFHNEGEGRYLEISLGEYDEKDIQRLHDIYGRI